MSRKIDEQVRLGTGLQVIRSAKPQGIHEGGATRWQVAGSQASDEHPAPAPKWRSTGSWRDTPDLARSGLGCGSRGGTSFEN